MPPSSRIPPLLQSHTRLPKDDSIFLLTSTLGASANWLIVRFLCEALSHDRNAQNVVDGGIEQDGKEDVTVILVSWMRDWEFWKSEARKGGGLDLERLRREKRLAFVDGLSKLFLSQVSSPPNQTPGGLAGGVQQTVMSVRGPPGRINPRAPTTTSDTSTPQASSTQVPGNFTVTSPELNDLESTIENTIWHLQSAASHSKILLILDTPSLLLASHPGITASSLSTTVMRLHKMTSHILVHIHADDALISLSTLPQPLEMDGYNFLVKMAHMSSRILSCRVLDTGVAKDVSGVLRVTENTFGFDLGLEQDADVRQEEKQGRELLYLIKGDGSVKLFERGAGGEG